MTKPEDDPVTKPQEAGETHWPFYTEPTVVDIRGQDTNYRRAGAGPTLVYLHGMGLTGKWLPFHQALSERVDLIAPELPGFGGTKLPDWLHSVDDAVTHLDDLLATIGIDSFHLAGHGLGGWIAARFSVVYPRNIQSLTLISSLGLRVPGHPLLDIFRVTPEETDDVLLNGTGADYAAELDLGDQVEGTVRAYREITASARMIWNPRYDVKFDRLLARVTAPSLVIAAQDDRVIPREHADRFAELLPNAELKVIEGTNAPTAHLSQLQEPTRLADMVADFVSEHDQEAQADA